MKRFLASILTIVALALPSITSAAPAWVQSAEGYENAVNTTQFSINGVTAGNFLVVSVRTSGVHNITVSSSPSESWTQDINLDYTLDQDTLDVWSATNVTGGNYTITVDIDADPRAIRSVANEFSGIATSSPLHQSSTGAETSGVSVDVDAGSITTTIDNCLIFVAGATDSDPNPWVAGTGFTITNDCFSGADPGQKICTEYKVSTSAGLYSNGFTLDWADWWGAAIIAYKPAASSGTNSLSSGGSQNITLDSGSNTISW
jgi:hypothetical protein